MRYLKSLEKSDFKNNTLLPIIKIFVKGFARIKRLWIKEIKR